MQKINVSSQMTAKDSGTYTLEEAMRILECRSRIERKIRKKSRKGYLMAGVLLVLGIMSVLVFAREDATAGVVLIIISMLIAIETRKGGIA